MSNQRWVTLATNDSYSLGALVLAHSLRRVGSAYPAVVLITPSVTEAMRERLRAVFAEVVLVDVLDSRDATHLALLQRPELGITFTKIHCWNLTQYEKCVFLDADTLVIQNCDELFEREELSAAPDVGWPDCFNSGVFVFKPSADTFSNLVTFAAERGSFDGGDQGLLNSYFSDWAHGDIKKHLPFLYNVTSAAFYSYLPALKHFGQNLKIIHFIGAIKPWLQQYNWESRSVEAPEHLRNFLQLWWDLFVADVHTQLDTTMDNIEEDSSLVVPQPEKIDYREPVLHSAYYEPILDPTSEFPWHHPDNQIPDSLIDVPEIDMSQFHDPWNIYRGNIPPSTEQAAPTEQTIDDYQDMRKYAWDYMPPQMEHYRTETFYNTEQQSNNADTNVQIQNESIQNYGSYSQHTRQQSHYSSFNFESPNSHQHTEHIWDHQQHLQENNHHETQVYHLHDYSGQQMSVSNNQEPHISHEHHYIYDSRPQDKNNVSKVPNYESQSNNNHVSSIPSNLHDQNISVKYKNEQNSFYSPLQNQNKDYQVYTVMMDHARMRCQHIAEAKSNGYVSDSDSDVYEELTPRHPYDGFYLRHRMTIDSHGRKICIHEIPLISRSPTPDSEAEFEDALDALVEDKSDKTIIELETQTGVAGNLARVVPGAPLQREAVDELTRRQGWEAGNIDYMGADSFDNIWAKIYQTLSQPPATETTQSTEPQAEPAPQQVSEPVAVETKMEVVEAVVAKEQSVLPTPEKEDIASPAEKKESEAPQSAPTEVSKSVESEVSKPVDTEVPKSEESVVPKAAEPEIKKPVETEAAKLEESEVSKAADSEVPKSTEPEESKSIVPEESASTPSDHVETSTPSAKEPELAEVPVPASDASAPASKVEEPIPVPAEIAAEIPVTVDVAIALESSQPADVPEKSDLAEIPVALKIDEPVAEATLPVTVVEQPSASEPVSEPVLDVPTTPAAEPAEVAAPPVEAAAPPAEVAPVPEAPAAKLEVGSDSPPLANTPSKEEIPATPAAKSEERRKPAGKLQLRPPVAADPLPTPDSELEDAASLAHAIIASELRTPTVTAPSPPALAAAPASLAPAAQLSTLSVQEPEVPTPPVDSVALAQIGVKPKPSTAARIESSVSAKNEPAPKAPEAAETPKKKVIKKVPKKDKEGASSAEAPVPPPRKKEKKPKEK